MPKVLTLISFIPTGISQLDHVAGSNLTSVSLAVSIPANQDEGVYISTVTIRDDDLTPSDTFFVYLNITGKSNLDILNNDRDVVSNIMTLAGNPGDAPAGEFSIENTGNIFLDNVAITCTNLVSGANTIPSASVTLSTDTINLTAGATTVIQVDVAISSYQASGIYLGTVKADDDDTSAEDIFTLKVNVNAYNELTIKNDYLDVAGSSVTVSGQPGTVQSGEFAVENTGNAELFDITFHPSDFNGGALASTAISFIPADIPSLPFESDSDLFNVSISANIPSTQAPGVYISTVNVRNAALTASDTFFFKLIVEQKESININNNSHEVSSNKMTLSAPPPAGPTGEFMVENNGNINLDNVQLIASDLVNGIYAISSSTITFSTNSYTLNSFDISASTSRIS